MTNDLMKPLPDQEVAIKKLRKVKARLCGDSMGVGKTVTGIGLDFAMREDDVTVKGMPTLIICEKIGIDVWNYHLRAMGVPDKEILLVDPADRSEFDAAVRQYSRTGKTDIRYFVIHWDALKLVPAIAAKKSNGRPKVTWAHVIADEVHLAKNRKALRTIELKRIATEYKTGLSGTPADDKPWDIWSVLHWLYPRKYRSYWTFYNEYVQYVASAEVGRWEKFKVKNRGLAGDDLYAKYREEFPTAGAGYRVPIGIQNVDQLHREMQPFYIRRTLLEVAPNMPEKIHVQPPIVVKMGAKQRKEYERMRDKAVALLGDNGFQLFAPAVVAVYTRLQQMALASLTPEWNVKDEEYVADEFDIEYDYPRIVLSKPSPKLDAVMNLITTHEEEPFVVFTQFRGMADLVEEECNRLKIPVVKIHGGILSKDQRTSLVSDFQDGKARVFVGTIAAAGKTITLTRASHVIFTDRSWNPSKNEQAEDRLWRRTQKNTVRVYDVMAEDSIDQIRMDKINTKAEMVAALNNSRYR